MKGQHGVPHNPGRHPRAVLEKIARIVSDDYTLTLTFAGPPARLDRQGIVLPESMLLDTTSDRMIGTVDLLIARRRHASPRALQALPVGLARALGQVIDDHRCARLLVRTHPGAAGFLRSRRRAETRRLRERGGMVAWEVRYLDALARRLWQDDDVDMGNDSDMATAPARGDAAQRLARFVANESLLHEALRRSEALIDVARNATSSAESATHALRLLSLIERLQRDRPLPPASAELDRGGAEGGDDAESSIESAFGDEASSTDEHDDGHADADEQPQAPPAASPRAHDVSTPPAPDLSAFEPELEALIDPLDARSRPGQPVSGAAIEAAVRAARASRRPASLFSVPLTREFDQTTDHSGRGDRSTWIALRREALRATGKLAQKLERALKAEQPDAWRYEQERGRINPAALGRLAAQPQYRTPFRIERPLASRQLAITILIDLSASMAGEKLQIAKLCAAAMASALGRLGYPFEVLGFSSIVDERMREHYQRSLAQGTDMRPFNRFVERLDLQVFKSFAVDDPSGLVAMRCGDQNPDGEALSWAAERLLARRGERHVMFVLSDGHPVTGDGHRRLLQSDLTLRIRRLQDQGIEMVGIGVGEDAAATYYDNAIVVRDLAALPMMAFDQLSRTLLNR